jgi:hypothetical protein
MRWVLAVLVAAGCAATEPPKEVKPVRAGPPAVPSLPPGPVALRNPDFAQDVATGARCATGWDCTVHANPKAFRFFVDEVAGRRSFCVEPAQGVKPEPWALATQGLYSPGLKGTRVRFSIALSLTGVSGDGAGPWIQVQRPAVPRMVTETRLVKQSGSWQVHSVELDVPADANTIEVGLMIKGQGRACFDDARLEVLQGPKNPV